MKLRGFDLAAVLIMVPVLAFWFWFGIGSALHEELGAGNWIAHLAVPGGVFLATLVLALKWRWIGGSLLLLEGCIILIGYPILVRGRFGLSTIALVLLTMAFPPAISGTLFLLSARSARAARGES
jgi:hypothetical protein